MNNKLMTITLRKVINISNSAWRTVLHITISINELIKKKRKYNDRMEFLPPTNPLSFNQKNLFVHCMKEVEK